MFSLLKIFCLVIAHKVLTPYIFLLGKLPKNYDPKVTPDPERWLPMKERSYYRGKKKGKKKDQIGKGTQGATAGASAEL